MIIRPTWAFLNGYFFKLGFLDGFEGFSFAINTSHQVFLKYSKLFKLQRSSKRKKITAAASAPLIPEKKSAVGEV
jgi:hypothetical protein